MEILEVSHKELDEVSGGRGGGGVSVPDRKVSTSMNARSVVVRYSRRGGGGVSLPTDPEG
ncbi:hypothetical protein [Algicola sagamiensis]|uniref:hypothetical protein n=1 Tax=Algicola sagamiensis TaxID=163869 RepID=UPI000382F335|nr:hypothetical protein [Algicola sagamiensis]